MPAVIPPPGTLVPETSWHPIKITINRIRATHTYPRTINTLTSIAHILRKNNIHLHMLINYATLHEPDITIVVPAIIQFITQLQKSTHHPYAKYAIAAAKIACWNNHQLRILKTKLKL